MTHESKNPASLSVVSYLFLVMGILRAVEMLGAVARGSFHFDFGVLGVCIFFGLRQRSPGWRRCALIFIWVGMIGLAYAFVYGFSGIGPAYIQIFGQRYADIPVIWVSVIAAIFLPVEIWMYRVLTRPDIRFLFYADSQPAAA